MEKISPSSHELRLSKEPKEYQNHKTTEDTSLVKIHGAQFFILLTNYTANFSWATVVSIDISGFNSLTSLIGGLSTVNVFLVSPINISKNSNSNLICPSRVSHGSLKSIFNTARIKVASRDNFYGSSCINITSLIWGFC